MDKLKEIINALQAYKEQKHASTGEYDTPSITIFTDGSGHVDLGDVEETSESFYGRGFLSTGLENALEKVKEMVKLNPTVDLNGSYSAEVSENGIEVGCQKISFEAFDKLAKVVAEVRKEAGNKVGDIVLFRDIKVGERAIYLGSRATEKPYTQTVWTKVGSSKIKNSRTGSTDTYEFHDTYWKIVE